MANKRSIFLINKPFQLRFALYVCSWIFVLSLIYPLMIDHLFNSFLEYVRLDPRGPELTKLESIRQEMRWLLVVVNAFFIVATFVISIFLSHRIAGPLYKLRLFFSDAAQGHIHKRLAFRRSDHFQELADGYNQLMDQLGGALNRSSIQLGGVIQQLEQVADRPGAPKEEIQKSLQTLKEVQRQTSLTPGA